VSITVGRPFTNQFRAWFLTPENGSDTIDESQYGLGWADGMMTCRRRPLAVQFDLAGTPQEGRMIVPGRGVFDAIDADEINGVINASQFREAPLTGV